MVFKLLFVAIWSLDTSIPSEDVAKAAARIIEKDSWPPEGSEIKDFLIFPGHRGITIMEASSEEAVWRSYLLWEKEIPGLFTEYEVHPAVSIETAIASVLED
jgi:hypothetical protein